MPYGPPRILFIDAASRFGWAFGTVGEQPASGSQLFAKSNDSSSAAVFWHAMRFVAQQIEQYGPDIIIGIEEPIAPSFKKGKTNFRTTRRLFGLPAAIEGMAFGMRCYGVRMVRVSEIRAYFIGKNEKGETAKPKVHRKCLDLGWVSPSDEDQSFDRTDALAGWAKLGSILAPKLAQPVDDLSVVIAARNRARAA